MVAKGINVGNKAYTIVLSIKRDKPIKMSGPITHFYQRINKF